MKIKTRNFLLLLMLACNSFIVYSQGLGFYSSYEKAIDKRTSYTVFANCTPTLKDEITISFDLLIPNPIQFGYICTIDVENIYSLSFVNQNGDIFLKLNLEGESNLLTIPLNALDWGKGKWNRLEICFKLHSNDISLLVNGKEFQCKGYSLSNSIPTNLYFGKHTNIIDVPAFSIRNLNIKDSKSNFHFKFEEDDGNIVHNKKGKPIGYIENPRWLINDSFHWKHRYSQKTKSVSAVQFDQQSNRLIIAEKDSVTFVNMLDEKVYKNAYLTQHPVPMILGMSCMNNNNLFLYELRNKTPGFPTIASLNLDTFKWETNSYTKLENERHHHNSYFDVEQQQLYIFGGFGDKRYYKSLYCYDLSSDSWNLLNLSGDRLPSRFFSSMGELDNHLIIFGGAGNTSGDQSIGKKYYYDCYSADLKEKRVKKLWEIDRGDTRLVSSRNLIFTPDSSSFYTICYPEYIPNTYLKLYNYKISNGEYTILGDSIPMVSETIKTNANIYANLNTSEIYCVIQQYEKGDSSTISIYSINNPPFAINSLKNNAQNVKASKASYVWILAALLAAILIVLFVFIYKQKKSKNALIEGNTLTDWTERQSEPIKNAICLFGDFAIFNRLGKEISYQFSPQMKELFLFIVCKSMNDGLGVNSEQIYNTIWPDKPLKSAKNLKGVTINKIRNILSDIDGIELIFENKHFILKTEEPLNYDYLFFNTIHDNTLIRIDDENIKKLSKIISRGQFLKSIEIDFLDSCKAEVSNQILTIAPRILKHYYSHKKFATCIYFAERLYNTDELNNCAFYFIIQSNLALKRVSEAKKQYAKYVVKYQKIQNEDYDLVFSDVVKASKQYLKEVV